MVQISEASLLISMKYEEIYPPSLENPTLDEPFTAIVRER